MAKNQVADGDAHIPDPEHFKGPVSNDVEILADVTEVEVILDEHEVAAKGTESAELGERLAALKAHRRAVLADLLQQKKDLEGARALLDEQITSRKETRQVEVDVFYNLTENTVTMRRCDNNELAGEAREMTEEERNRILKMRQVEIPGTEGEEGGEA